VTKRPATPAPPADLDCELTEELGSGATGSVWAGRLTAEVAKRPAGTPIALKRLHAEAAGRPAEREAFERESRLVLALQQPGVVAGLARGEDEAGPWLAMERVPGPSLRELALDSGAQPEPLVRAVFAGLTEALLGLHGAGWLHGDIKPENVRLDADGRPILIDLGFAHRPSQPESAARVAGSLAYLSPEELRGEPADERSELYSVGVLLYELATGTHPFVTAEELASGEGLVGRLLGAEFELPSLRVPTLSPFLDRLLEALLDGDPERRPAPKPLRGIAAEQEASGWWRAQLDAPELAPRAAGAASLLPWVGRERELARLVRAATRAFSAGPDDSPPPGGAVELCGSSGAGKSRLMREFARRVRLSAEPPLILQGRCGRFEERRPGGPLIDLLGHYLSLPPGAAPGPRERAILDDLLASRESETLLEVLEPAFEGTTAAAVPAALCTWLLRLARRGPVAIYLDDLDFADEATLEVLSRLTRRGGDRPLLMIVGRDREQVPRRPRALRQFEERLEAVDSFERIELAPLDPEAVRALTEALFHRSAPRLRLAKVLWDRSRGNPGLLSELVRGLVDRGEAVPGEEGLELRIHPEDLPLPASLRSEIVEAWSRLAPRDRVWIARLAVAGGRIETEFLARAWPEVSAADLDATLTRLTHRGWLRPAGDRYRFRRPALRAAVYKRLAPRRLRQLHGAVAAALRPGPGGRQSLADAFQRAFHLRAAGAYEELMRFLPPLLQRLHDRGQLARVYTLGRWGLEALEHLPDAPGPPASALDFLVAATDAADRLGYREKQRELLDRLAELELDPEAQAAEVGRVYLLHARHAIGVGLYGPGIGMLNNALRNFLAAGDEAGTSETLLRLATAHGHLGRMDEGRRLARRARAHAPGAFERARAEHALGVLDMLDGELESALRRSDRCLMELRRAQVFEALSVRAMAHALRARVYRGAGRPRRGLVSAQHALRFAQRSGDRLLEIELQARLGVHLLDVDRVEEAEMQLRDALLLAAESEDRRGESIAALFLGILLAEQDDPEGASQLARCRRVAQEMGLARTEAVCIAIQARILFQRDPQAALELSDKALELLDRAGAELIDRIVIRGTHAMILAKLGRRSESAAQVDRLRRRMRAATGRIESAVLQRRQRLATRELLKAALSPEGPVYRRVRLERGRAAARPAAPPAG